MPQFKSTIIKIDFSDHFSIVNTLETNETSQKPVHNLPASALTVKKLLTNLQILCKTEIGMILKKFKTPIKHINTFLIS